MLLKMSQATSLPKPCACAVLRRGCGYGVVLRMRPTPVRAALPGRWLHGGVCFPLNLSSSCVVQRRVRRPAQPTQVLIHHAGPPAWTYGRHHCPEAPVGFGRSFSGRPQVQGGPGAFFPQDLVAFIFSVSKSCPVQVHLSLGGSRETELGLQQLRLSMLLLLGKMKKAETPQNI